MFLIMSNLIPLNHSLTEHAAATVETPSAICYPPSDSAGHALWLICIIRLAALWLNIGLSLPYLKQLQDKKQCALGITDLVPTGTAFFSQSKKESQDSQRQSWPNAEKIIYTFDALPTETN